MGKGRLPICLPLCPPHLTGGYCHLGHANHYAKMKRHEKHCGAGWFDIAKHGLCLFLLTASKSYRIRCVETAIH